MNFGVEKLTDKYTSGKEKNQVALSLLNSTHSNVSFPRKIYFLLRWVANQIIYETKLLAPSKKWLTFRKLFFSFCN